MNKLVKTNTKLKTGDEVIVITGKDIGKKGLEWALSDEAGLTAKKMSNRIIEGMDELFDTWEPREKFEFLKDTDFEKKVLKHKLIY